MIYGRHPRGMGPIKIALAENDLGILPLLSEERNGIEGV